MLNIIQLQYFIAYVAVCVILKRIEMISINYLNAVFDAFLSDDFLI